MAQSEANGSASNVFDYIIVGAGIGGTVVASRLHERDPSLSILLIEAGPYSSETAMAGATAVPSRAVELRGSELDWNYQSVPQKHMGGIQLYNGGGKAIGGSSVVNYGVLLSQ